MAQQSQSFWFTPKGLAALGLIGAVSYFLLMEHREHLFQFLPFLILLLCPGVVGSLSVGRRLDVVVVSVGTSATSTTFVGCIAVPGLTREEFSS